jgi:orotidine-5'-phosphate decarboxylase
MTYEQLYQLIIEKESFLCVGLDTDISKIPHHLQDSEDPIFEFNKEIIDSTIAYTVAYKPNVAFYEANGSKGWNSLEKTVRYISEQYPNTFLIADAKRGDIGNTSNMYAKAFFELMNFDAVTVSPYLGSDSVKPFLMYPKKWAIILALTSNDGAFDFQFIKEQGSEYALFEKIILTSQQWGTEENMMFVVGATKAEMLKRIREFIPEHFLLVPGIGAQGGDLDAVAENAITSNCGLLVNSSRNIIYASNDKYFAHSAAMEAQKLQKQMSNILKKYNVI